MSKCEWCDYKENEWLLHKTSHWSVYLADVQDYVGRCILVLNGYMTLEQFHTYIEQSFDSFCKKVIRMRQSTFTVKLADNEKESGLCLTCLKANLKR